MTPRLLSFTLLALLAAGCNSQAAPEAAPSPAEPATPAGVVEQTAPAPRLQLDTVDGMHYDLAERRGKWVVVNFWATWCGPCLHEMPELSGLHAKGGNVEVIGLAYEDIAPDEMQAFLEKRPVSYPIAILDPYNPPQDFATPRGLPVTYLIAPDGKVAKQFVGPVDAQQLEQAIAEAGGKAV